MIARDLMTPDPMAVSPQATITEAWEIMREAEIRHLPVIDDGVLVGMVSDRDLARLGFARLIAAEGADALRRELDTRVGTVMSPDVVGIEPETDVGEIVELLLEHKIGALPVVDRSTDTVVGIVSYVDVLRALRGTLGEE